MEMKINNATFLLNFLPSSHPTPSGQILCEGLTAFLRNKKMKEVMEEIYEWSVYKLQSEN